MISYLQGKLLKKENDRVVILTHGVGYEVVLPPVVRQALDGKNAGNAGDEIELHIFYHHPERQPRPMLEPSSSKRFVRKPFGRLACQL